MHRKDSTVAEQTPAPLLPAAEAREDSVYENPLHNSIGFTARF